MRQSNHETQPSRYVIQVKNHLDSNWEHWFEGMVITHEDEKVTVLTGPVADQSALFGLLEKIHNLNLTLILVQKMESESLEE